MRYNYIDNVKCNEEAKMYYRCKFPSKMSRIEAFLVTCTADEKTRMQENRVVRQRKSVTDENELICT